MKKESVAYIAPEMTFFSVDSDEIIMTSVTGNSSTEDLTEETFTW